MTAKELIQKLQKLAPDTRIIIRGYEDGYNDIIRLIPLLIIPHPGQKADYYGEYTTAQTGKEKINAINAVELCISASASLSQNDWVTCLSWQ